MRKISIVFFTAAILFSCNSKESISVDPKGVGPIVNLELTTINDSLMKVGFELFKDRCSQCHTMEFKNSGPDISDLLAVREPEWFMNFMINKEEMIKRDAAAIRTRVKYKIDCGSDITTEKESLELLEYLRIYQIWLHEFNVK